MKALLLGITLLLAGCDYARDFIGGGAPANAAAQMVTMDTAGVVARRVLADLPINYVSALPDERTVVKNDWKMGELVLYDLESGATRRLTHHNLSPWDSGGAFGPSVSPDGRFVAYNWEGYKPSYSVEVRLVDLAGGTPRVLFRDVDWVEVRSWSPDGRSFVAVNEPKEGGAQILLIPIDRGQPRVVRTLSDWPGKVIDFSPDGRSLIYDRAVETDDGNRDIYLLELETDREYPIIQSPADDQLLGWMPGSSNILFSSDRTGTTGVWNQRLENGRAEGAPVLVKPDFWRGVPIGFTKDGTFYYSVQSSGPNVWTATVDLVTGAVGAAELLRLSEPITRQAALGWSSDGRALGVLSDGGGLTVRSLASGESRTYPLPRPRYYPGAPMRWSADGTAIFWRARVAYDAKLSLATWGLLRFDLSTGQTVVFDVPVKERETFDWFELLPDGNSALVRRRLPTEATADSQNVARLSVLDLKTRAERNVFEVRGSGLPFAVSPDGSLVAVAPLAVADRGPGEVLRGSSELYVIPLNGAPEPRKIATGPARFRRFVDLLWEPSGKAIFQVTNAGTAETALRPLREHEVDRFALDGSPLKTFKLTDPQGARYPVLLSPTANRLAYLAGEAAYELWALEGLPGSASAPR